MRYPLRVDWTPNGGDEGGEGQNQAKWCGESLAIRPEELVVSDSCGSQISLDPHDGPLQLGVGVSDMMKLLKILAALAPVQPLPAQLTTLLAEAPVGHVILTTQKGGATN